MSSRGPRPALVHALAVWVLVLGACGDAPPRRPSFVVVMTDDQRWDELRYMPVVLERLAGRGVQFLNSFVTTSLCCPSRASFLTGRTARHHGITSLGGAPLFDASSTLAVWLQAAGYDTALIGKYMNDNLLLRGAIPPGWSRWRTFADTIAAFRGDALYFDYKLNVDGKIVHYGDAERDYSTDVLREMALQFIRESAEGPFFLLFAPFAPHWPPVPAPRHAGALKGIDLPVYANDREPDSSDKPPYVRAHQGFVQALPDAEQKSVREGWDEGRVGMLESLLAVDEAVGAILDLLRDLEIEGDTVVIFTSDNGSMWGEHWLIGKTFAYEESIRVPLVLLDPRLDGTPREVEELVLNVDLAPTIAELAGASPPAGLDGRSLVPLLDGSSGPWREDFLYEWFHWHPYYAIPPIEAVRSRRWKYIWNGYGDRPETGELFPPEPVEELYDLSRDPHETENLLVTRPDDPGQLEVLEQMRARWRTLRAR